MKQVFASSPGKIILLGEHAVVYDQPAISMGIDLYSHCIIEDLIEPNIEIELLNYGLEFKFKDFNELKSYFPSQFQFLIEALTYLSDFFQVKLQKIKMILYSAIWVGSGLGSSASISVALISALNSFYSLNLDQNKINEISYHLETFMHGKPSGIDNYTCTYGNILYFDNFTKKNPQILHIPSSIFLLVCNSGKSHNTRDVIQQIQKIKNHNPSYFQTQMESIGNIVQNAKNALELGDFTLLGKLMNENQNILYSLGISTEEIDQIISLALANGAYGAKLTGAGKGGCVIILIDLPYVELLQYILHQNQFETLLVKPIKEAIKHVIIE